jgi:hypothetical protein
VYCTTCSAGSYQSGGVCATCGAGSYSDLLLSCTSLGCTACAAGTYSSFAAASSSTLCAACSAGSYSSLPAGAAAFTQEEIHAAIDGAAYADGAVELRRFKRFLNGAEKETDVDPMRVGRSEQAFKAHLKGAAERLAREGSTAQAMELLEEGNKTILTYGNYVRQGGGLSFDELLNKFEADSVDMYFIGDCGDEGTDALARRYSLIQLINRETRKLKEMAEQGLPGPRGPPGPQGPRGQQGQQGAQGRAGAAAVGVAAPFGGGSGRLAGGGGGGGRGGGRGGGDGRARVPEALRARARAENWANVDQATWGALDPSRCWRCNGARHGLAGACTNPILSA